MAKLKASAGDANLEHERRLYVQAFHVPLYWLSNTSSSFHRKIRVSVMCHGRFAQRQAEVAELQKRLDDLAKGHVEDMNVLQKEKVCLFALV